MPFQRGSDNLVVLLILAILGVLAYQGVSRYREQRKSADCLGRLATGQGGACPVSGQAYPADAPRRCAAAASHLPTDPRFDGPRVRQTFPAAKGPADVLPIPDWTRWARVETSASGVAVTFTSRAWWRYAVGPLLILLGLLGWLLLGAYFGIELGRRPRYWPLLVMYGLLLALVGLLLWNGASSAWGRETWAVDRAARTVTQRRFVLGLELGAPRVHADVRALAPVGTSRPRVTLVGADGRAVPLFAVTPDGIGALAPLHAALFPDAP